MKLWGIYKSIITIVLCHLVSDSYGQYFSDLSQIGVLPPAITRFIPNGYSTLDTASGDLNMDGINDMVLILKRNGEDTMTGETPRPVLLLTGSKHGTYTQKDRNDKIAYCYTCGGMNTDPLMGITIKGDYLSIENGIMGGQHWQHVITFHYDRSVSDWYLSRDGFESYKSNPDRSDTAEALIIDRREIKTVKDFGKVRFVDFDIHKDW